MNIYEKIKTLCQENGLNITRLEELCGLSQNSIKKWDKRDSLPSGETTVKLVQHLHVSADYLLGLTDIPTAQGQAIPSAPKSEIQEIYDSLSLFQQREVLGYIRQLKEEEEEEEEKQMS